MGGGIDFIQQQVQRAPQTAQAVKEVAQDHIGWFMIATAFISGIFVYLAARRGSGKKD